MADKLFSKPFRTRLCCGLLLFALGLRLVLWPGTGALLHGAVQRIGSTRLLTLCLQLGGVHASAEAAPPTPAASETAAAPPAEPGASAAPVTAETAAPSAPAAAPAAAALQFVPAEAEAIELRGSCDYTVDIPALLNAPLYWQAQLSAPTVLILHSHTCEAYTQSEGYAYEPSADFRTLDETRNMLAVGDALAAELTARGITVLHDRSIHDYPSYNDSYANAKLQTEAFLAEYPSVVLVLDLHRDAMDEPVREAVTLDGQDCAKLMLVVGTDEGGLYHPYWQDNLCCALKLQALLNRSAPGLMRPLNLRSERFNGQTSPGAMIVEVGSTGNYLPEALRSMPYLADAVETLLRASAVP